MIVTVLYFDFLKVNETSKKIHFLKTPHLKNLTEPETANYQQRTLVNTQEAVIIGRRSFFLPYFIV